jgi:hypothetical protein
MAIGTTTTRVTPKGVVESTIAGRAVGQTITDMVTSFRKLNRGRDVWVIRAEQTTGYAPDAIAEAVSTFGDLCTRHGLKKIVAVIKTPTVRMGAQVVSMSLRAAGSPLEIVVVDDIEAAEGALG